MDNIFYQVLAIVTDPLLRTRWITPRVVLDGYIPAIAFGLVLWLWLAIVFWVLPEMCSSGLRLHHAARGAQGRAASPATSSPSFGTPKSVRTCAATLGSNCFSLRYSARTFSGSPSLNQAAASW